MALYALLYLAYEKDFGFCHCGRDETRSFNTTFFAGYALVDTRESGDNLDEKLQPKNCEYVPRRKIEREAT